MFVFYGNLVVKKCGCMVWDWFGFCDLVSVNCSVVGVFVLVVIVFYEQVIVYLF